MMLLAHAGVGVSYERVHRILNIQSYGAPFSNLRHLQVLGCTVHIEHGELADLWSYVNIGLPCVIPVLTNELPYWLEVSTQHAVVVIGMDSQNALLHDPAFDDGRFLVSVGDLELAWIERDQMYATIYR